MQGLAFQFWWLFHQNWADPTRLITKLSTFILLIYLLDLKKKFTYLFVLCLSCATQDIRCIMWDFSLQCMGSLIVMHRFRCSKACRILLPRPGI